jgi:hypothetical protein
MPNLASPDTRNYDFYHATDARRQGIGTLIGVSIFMAAFVGILYFFHSRLEMRVEGSALYIMAGILTVVFFGFIAYASILIVKGGQWVFVIRDGVLCVQAPAKSVGETFTVFVADILSITQEQIGSDENLSVQLYLVMQDGTKHEITQNSSLNWIKLFNKLCELNPSIRKEYNTPSDLLKTFAFWKAKPNRSVNAHRQ